MSRSYNKVTNRAYGTMHNLFDAVHSGGDTEATVQVLSQNVDLAQEALIELHGLPRRLIEGLSAIALVDVAGPIPADVFADVFKQEDLYGKN
jgi:hypothetical protein